MGNSSEKDLLITPKILYDRVENKLVENGYLVAPGVNGNGKKIAQFFDVTPSTVSKWKLNFPGADILVTIASRLNVSLDWLLTGEEFHKEAPTATQKEPDPAEPVQTEKDIDDYTVADVCKAFVALAKIFHIELKYSTSSIKDLYDSCEFEDTMDPQEITVSENNKVTNIDGIDGLKAVEDRGFIIKLAPRLFSTVSLEYLPQTKQNIRDYENGENGLCTYSQLDLLFLALLQTLENINTAKRSGDFEQINKNSLVNLGNEHSLVLTWDGIVDIPYNKNALDTKIKSFLDCYKEYLDTRDINLYKKLLND